MDQPRTAEQLLKRPMVLIERYQQAAETLADQFHACANMTASYSGMPMGGGGGDAKDMPLAAFSDAGNTVRQLHADYLAAKRAVADFLFALHRDGGIEDRLYRLLVWRYRRLDDWKRVREALTENGKAPSYATVFRWHKKALEQAERYWESLHSEGEET